MNCTVGGEHERWLDDRYPALRIHDEVILASESVRELRPVLYEQLKTEQLRDTTEALRERVRREFPSIVALPMRRFDLECESDLERVLVLRDIWEACGAIVFALALGEARHRILKVPIDPPPRVASWQMYERLRLARTVVRAVGESLTIASKLGNKQFRALIGLNMIRNQRLPMHRSSLTEDEALARRPKIESKLMKLLGELRWLEDVEFFRVHKRIDRQRVRVETFRGDDHRRTIETHPRQLTAPQARTISDHPNEGAMFARLRDLVVCVSPILHWVREKRICVLAKHTATGLGYLPTHGDEFSIESPECSDLVDDLAAMQAVFEGET